MLNSLPGRQPFLLGIGGTGMAALAHILVDYGLEVKGYDQKTSANTRSLIQRGVDIYQTSIPPEIDFAIYSSAINQTSHPLFLELQQKKIPLYHRSEILHFLFSIHPSIAVAGSHGKTSTTGMLAKIFMEADGDPSVMLGGECSFLQNRGGRWGNSSLSVFESDESDGTFLNHTAPVRIVTNIDDDHLDYYQNSENLLQAFRTFIFQRPGTAIINLDDVGVQKCIATITEPQVRIIACGERKTINTDWLEYYPIHFKQSGVVILDHCEEVFIQIPLPGKHYLRNACLAYLAAKTRKLSTESIQRALGKYNSVKRRLEFLGTYKGVRVYDDYGHHPTEILAVIESLQPELAQGGRLIVLFQPHRYSRTKKLYREFARALSGDFLSFLLPIYSAGEPALANVSSEMIIEPITGPHPPVLLPTDRQEGVERLKQSIRPGDILLCIGAGDVYQWGQCLLGNDETSEHS